MSLYKKEIIDFGDRISKLASEKCRASYGFSRTIDVISNQSNFRSPVGLRWKEYILRQMLDKKMYELPQNDGAGNKPNFCTLAADPKAFFNLAWEIAAMCADDVARWGGLPSHFVSDQIDFKNVTEKNFFLAEAVVNGLGEMLNATRMAMITGESAIMKYSITAFCDTGAPEQLILTWTGTCIGLMHNDKLIDGSQIEADQPIVGLHEPWSYRCNGGTLHAQNLIRCLKKGDDIKEYLKMLVIPSTSFANSIARIHGWLPDGQICDALAAMTGICHWTGGGIKKFIEILPPNVGAELMNMPPVPRVQILGQALSEGTPDEISDWQAYESLHPGCAILAVCKTEGDANRLIYEMALDGHGSSIVGRTTASKDNEVLIKSGFMNGGILTSKDLE